MFIVVPYRRGLSEKFKKTCSSLGIQVHFKGNNTIQTIGMAPKDKDNMCQKSRVIYKFKCSRTDCTEQYAGESGRTFGDRFREHLRAPSISTVSPQDIQWIWNTSPPLIRRHRGSPGPLKKLCNWRK